jgi:hypothetical protein
MTTLDIVATVFFVIGTNSLSILGAHYYGYRIGFRDGQQSNREERI